LIWWIELINLRSRCEYVCSRGHNCKTCNCLVYQSSRSWHCRFTEDTIFAIFERLFASFHFQLNSTKTYLLLTFFTKNIINIMSVLFYASCVSNIFFTTVTLILPKVQLCNSFEEWDLIFIQGVVSKFLLLCVLESRRITRHVLLNAFCLSLELCVLEFRNLRLKLFLLAEKNCFEKSENCATRFYLHDFFWAWQRCGITVWHDAYICTYMIGDVRSNPTLRPGPDPGANRTISEFTTTTTVPTYVCSM
jgi:hypothetical protein